jgi:hypothetical protein
MAFTFAPSGQIFSQTVVVIDSERFSDFCILQSRVHEYWARKFSSSMKDDLRFTPSDCFATYPMPSVNTEAVLAATEEAGRAFFETRKEICNALNIGLTEVFNRESSPRCSDEYI